MRQEEDWPRPTRDLLAGFVRLRASDAIRNRMWATAAARVLVVRHPFRQAGFHDGFLDWLARNLSSLRRHFELALLPATDVDLGAIHLLVPWLQDPVEAWSPVALDLACRLVERCGQRGIPVVNHPVTLARAGKRATAERLAAAGIRAPRVLPVTADTCAFVRASLSGPILIREDWQHQATAILIPPGVPIDPACLARFRRPIAVEFVDTRGRDGLFRKYRCLVAGDHAISVHLIASRDWEVRGGSKIATAELLAEEARYIARPDPYQALFRQARAIMGFDLVAFDYSRFPDGRIVVWEANPHPFVRFGDRAPDLRYRDRAVHRIYGAMTGLYLERAGLAVPGVIEALRHYGVPHTDLLMGRLAIP